MYTAPGLPPPPTPVDPAAIRPRRSMFLVALGIFVVGLIAGIVVIVLSVQYNDLTPEQVTGGKLRVSALDRTLYSTSAFDTEKLPSCTFTGPGSITLDPMGTPNLISRNGTRWYSVAALHATKVGTYTVSCPRAQGRLAVAGGAGALVGIFGRIFLGIGIMVVGLLAGGIMSIVVGVRRTSSRNRLQSQLRPGAGVPYGAPGPFGQAPPGYGQYPPPPPGPGVR